MKKFKWDGDFIRKLISLQQGEKDLISLNLGNLLMSEIIKMCSLDELKTLEVTIAIESEERTQETKITQSDVNGIWG